MPATVATAGGRAGPGEPPGFALPAGGGGGSRLAQGARSSVVVTGLCDCRHPLQGSYMKCYAHRRKEAAA